MEEIQSRFTRLRQLLRLYAVWKISSPSRPASQALMTSQTSSLCMRARRVFICFCLSLATVYCQLFGRMGKSSFRHLPYFSS